jgi:hypothetical protein
MTETGGLREDEHLARLRRLGVGIARKGRGDRLGGSRRRLLLVRSGGGEEERGAGGGERKK